MSEIHPDFSSLSFLRESVRLGLLRDPIYPKLLEFQNLDPSDADISALLQEGLLNAQKSEILAPNPFRAEAPNSQRDLHGELLLGQVSESGVPWCLPHDLMTQHTLCVGRSGGGKTNLFLLIVLELLCHESQ